ncbi:PTS galactitol transporter subunit IIC [Thermohalobacter berrensis]|uniref:PTS galactitol transporter subunit IIC n=1 Tax=Thermohalobacter berrensis TaxID=99594 RepID=A0A419SZ36_9FIRM|nr:PTS transporter subunit IIC [Thermohalobacter berrensis]RKD30520.1 PTS galactitol transporter subunit IIC [Thermohalobacter berrensis]
MLKSIINYILDLGPAVFLPALMIIIGLIIRMKFRKAFTSALTLGVAFLGMSVVLDFMFSAIGPASEAFVKNTGLQLKAIDLGWTPLAAIAWAWPYAFLIFPIQIAINLIMLAFGWTNCLNVDMWNVWNKILTAVLVAGVTGSLPAAFIVAGIQVIFELKNADITQKQVYQITRIPGIALPHSMSMFAVVLAPLNRLLDFIPGLKNADVDAAKLKEKIGIFGENHVMGFIIGILIALFAKYDFKQTLTLGVQAATALTLFPMVAKLFMQALAPISDAAGEFMKKRFPGREFYIGLDWPFLAGQPELWVAAIILVPFILLMAVILPGNAVLPFGGIINICFVVPALIVTGKNLVRMVILGVITTPVFLYIATTFAPIITDLGKKVGTVEIPANQLITWNGMEMPVFRWVFSQGADIINGNFLGFAILVGWLAIYVWYYKHMKKREEIAEKELSANA